MAAAETRVTVAELDLSTFNKFFNLFIVSVKIYYKPLKQKCHLMSSFSPGSVCLPLSGYLSSVYVAAPSSFPPPHSPLPSSALIILA